MEADKCSNCTFVPQTVQVIEGMNVELDVNDLILELYFLWL